jgi:hypothetical protein
MINKPLTTEQLQELLSVAEQACEWPTQRFSIVFDPTTCAELVRRLMSVEKELTEIRACDKCDLCEDHHQ